MTANDNEGANKKKNSNIMVAIYYTSKPEDVHFKKKSKDCVPANKRLQLP